MQHSLLSINATLPAEEIFGVPDCFLAIRLLSSERMIYVKGCQTVTVFSSNCRLTSSMYANLFTIQKSSKKAQAAYDSDYNRGISINSFRKQI
jgi:hypothetical protein